MSDHTICRKRLAALEDAIATITDAYRDTTTSSPMSVFSDRLAGDTMGRGEIGANGAVWLTVADIVVLLREIRDDLEAMTQSAESFALGHGPVQWNGNILSFGGPDE